MHNCDFQNVLLTFLCFLAILGQARVRLRGHHFTRVLLPLQDHWLFLQLGPRFNLESWQKNSDFFWLFQTASVLAMGLLLTLLVYNEMVFR